ncbi:rod shape-determining protein [Brevundimonas sp.]|uniref:rod shape-determining protein n=1 Tax=Brevundimonas sp. TaxID=1871086 RepID=UPI0026851603|nr:rod shape-determining protein [Brevundimonas sp.]
MISKKPLSDALNRLLKTTAPNYPIEGFRPVDRDTITGIIDALDVSSEDGIEIILNEIDHVFKEIDLVDDDLTQDQLLYYYAFSKVREAATALRSSGSIRQTQNLFVKSNDYEKDITAIKAGIEEIQKTIELVREETFKHPLEGMSLNVGPIGLPVTSLIRSADLAIEVLAHHAGIDVIALSLHLQTITNSANSAYKNALALQNLPGTISTLLRHATIRAASTLKIGLSVLARATAKLDDLPPLSASVTATARAFRLTADYIGVDFGTSEIRLVARGRGVVSRSQSTPAIKGADLTRAEWLRTVKWADRPIMHGVIADPLMAEDILKRAARSSGLLKAFSRPKFIAAVTSGSSAVERREMRRLVKRLPSGSIQLVEGPIAAALGAGLEVSTGEACMVGDIGAGKTDISLIAFNGIVYSRTLKVGGDDMTLKIGDYLFRSYNMYFTVDECERLKLGLAKAHPVVDAGDFEVIVGADSLTKRQKEVKITDAAIGTAINEPLLEIIDSFRLAIEALPPELSHSVQRAGIALTGGVARLPGLAEELARWTGFKFWVADEPELAVSRGLARIMDDPNGRQILEVSN